MFSFEPLANARSSLSQPKPEPITRMALLAQGAPLGPQTAAGLTRNTASCRNVSVVLTTPFSVFHGDDLIHESEEMHCWRGADDIHAIGREGHSGAIGHPRVRLTVLYEYGCTVGAHGIHL